MNILFPGSFNPFHAGHRDIANAVSTFFPDSELYIGILVNPNKNYDITLDERVKDVKNRIGMKCNVIGSNDTVASLINDLNIDIVIRGMRTYKDAEEDTAYVEYIQEHTNARVVYIQSQPKNKNLSSTKIRNKND